MDPRITKRQPELEALCRRFLVRRLELFGSAAAGASEPGKSDLDFLVEFQALPPKTYADTYFELLESLEELFDAPVDLVVTPAIKNPYFKQSVDKTKALLDAA